MFVRLKFRLWANGIIYEQGVQEVPDDTMLPSSAEMLDEKPEPAPAKKSKEPETLRDLLPTTKQEQTK